MAFHCSDARSLSCPGEGLGGSNGSFLAFPASALTPDCSPVLGVWGLQPRANKGSGSKGGMIG